MHPLQVGPRLWFDVGWRVVAVVVGLAVVYFAARRALRSGWDAWGAARRDADAVGDVDDSTTYLKLQAVVDSVETSLEGPLGSTGAILEYVVETEEYDGFPGSERRDPEVDGIEIAPTRLSASDSEGRTRRGAIELAPNPERDPGREFPRIPGIGRDRRRIGGSVRYSTNQDTWRTEEFDAGEVPDAVVSFLRERGFDDLAGRLADGEAATVKERSLQEGDWLRLLGRVATVLSARAGGPVTVVPVDQFTVGRRTWSDLRNRFAVVAGAWTALSLWTAVQVVDQGRYVIERLGGHSELRELLAILL